MPSTNRTFKNTFCPKGIPKVATVNSYEPLGYGFEGLLTRITSSNFRYQKKNMQKTPELPKRRFKQPYVVSFNSHFGRFWKMLTPPSPPRTAHIDMRPVTFGGKSPQKTRGGGGSLKKTHYGGWWIDNNMSKRHGVEVRSDLQKNIVSWYYMRW